MSESASKPVFYVNAYSEPVLVRIEGRACFQNSGFLRDFVAEMVRQGKGAFVVDFLKCTGMDSTFLGVLAGAALELRKKAATNSLVLVRVGPRNLELIRNLGLHRLLTVDSGDYSMNFDKGGSVLVGPAQSELENARLVIEAHENLVSADATNAAKFQDVLVFLKSRVEGR
jgi:anti-anti-sigma regulatory factor